MPRRRAILFSAACTFVITSGMTSTGMTGIMSREVFSGSAAAAPAVAAHPAATAKAFVTKIYDAYKGRNSKGVSIEGEAAIRSYFEPALAAMIIKDDKAAARRKEAPVLEFDPFVDGQEWELSDVSIAVSERPANQAVAIVSCKNFGLPTKIVLNLVRTKGGWQIADITWERGDSAPETLRGLFKH